MLLLSGGNMFRRKEKELEKKLFEVQEERDRARREAQYHYDRYLYERMSYFSECEKVKQLEEELERQKSISAEHISRYYDVVQKLKTVMEETNYGQNL